MFNFLQDIQISHFTMEGDRHTTLFKTTLSMDTEFPTPYPLVITKYNLDQLWTLNAHHSVSLLHKCEQDRRGKRRNFFFFALYCKHSGISSITKEADFFYIHVCVMMVYQLHCCISVYLFTVRFFYMKSSKNSFFFFFCGAVTQRGSRPPLSRGFQITHNQTPPSTGLLWTSDQLVAEIST